MRVRFHNTQSCPRCQVAKPGQFKSSWGCARGAVRYASTTRKITEDDRRRIYIQGTGNISIFIAFCILSRPNPPPVTLLSYTNHRFVDFIENGARISLIYKGERSEVSPVSMEVVALKGTHVAPLSHVKRMMLSSFRLDSDGVKLVENPFAHAVPEVAQASPDISQTPVPQLLPNKSPGASDLKNLYLPTLRKARASRERLSVQPPPKAEDIRIVDTAQHISQRPFMNFIVTTKSAHVRGSLKELGDRIRPDSTVLFLERGMGLLEDLFENVWTNPRTRPNCLTGILT